MELMACVQLTTTCLVVSVKTTTATATGMTDVVTPSLAAICMRQTAETTADARAIPGAVTLIAAAVIVTGTAPLATVSATGS